MSCHCLIQSGPRKGKECGRPVKPPKASERSEKGTKGTCRIHVNKCVRRSSPARKSPPKRKSPRSPAKRPRSEFSPVPVERYDPVSNWSLIPRSEREKIARVVMSSEKVLKLSPYKVVKLAGLTPNLARELYAQKMLCQRI